MWKLIGGLALAFLILTAAGGEARAAVFHWVDENGVHHYTNDPSGSKAEKLSIWEDGGGDPNTIYLDPQYNQIINEACAYYKVDPALIKAMIKCESNFNRYAVSHAGAQGLMQLMPGTARRFNVSDPFHPVENIWAGVYYVKFLMVLFNNDYDRVIAGYNAGENAVIRYGGIPPYKETRGYVKRVNYYWALYKEREPRWERPK
jgi:soluble lytic murein transglycosylase-like protein